MAQISRIYTFTAGTIVVSAEVNGELDQLVSAHNDLDSTRVKKAGDTMTGFLTLNAAPTANLHAATKKYIDDLIANPSVSGAISVDTINEFTPAAEVSFPDGIKVDTLTKAAGTHIDVLSRIEMAAGVPIYVDDIFEKTVAHGTEFHTNVDIQGVLNVANALTCETFLDTDAIRDLAGSETFLSYDGTDLTISVPSTGNLAIGNIPTSNAGLAAGEIYRDGAGADAALKIK